MLRKLVSKSSISRARQISYNFHLNDRVKGELYSSFINLSVVSLAVGAKIGFYTGILLWGADVWDSRNVIPEKTAHYHIGNFFHRVITTTLTGLFWPVGFPLWFLSGKFQEYLDSMKGDDDIAKSGESSEAVK